MTDVETTNGNGKGNGTGTGVSAPLATNVQFTPVEMRVLSVLLDRSQFARLAGLQFKGVRDLYTIFGYDDVITTQQYREEYARDGIAKRVVEAFPKATWRGGVELYEDEDPATITPFERAWLDLEKKHHVWSTLQAVDILAGLSTYAVLLIGAPGTLDTELPRGNENSLLYLQPYFGGGGPGTNNRADASRTQAADANVTIETFDVDPASPRFGEPLTYRILRTDFASSAILTAVHWTRMIHVAEGALDNRVYGVPTLESIWNRLFDLEKVTGGGSESYFQRAKHSLNLNIQKDASYGPDDLAALTAKLEEYKHGITNMIPTREVDVKLIEASVTNFSPAADAILKQIAGAKGIPIRILTGSEQGSLASDQDATNFDSQVQDRRTGYAGPLIVRKLVDRLIEYGYLPTPAQYEVGWPVEENMDENEKADYALKLATVNKTQGVTVFTDDEIREMAFDRAPLDDAQKVPIGAPERISVASPPPLDGNGNPVQVPGQPAVAKTALPQLKAAEAELLSVLEDAVRAGNTDVVLKIVGLQHKFGTTQVQLPPDVAERLFAIGRAIPDDDINEQAGGRLTDAHVTVKYGLIAPIAERLANVVLSGRGLTLGKMGRVSLTLGSTNIFATPDYDVVYVEVTSPDLADLNQAITSRMECAPSDHGFYLPHATVAYVKAGRGNLYKGLEPLSGVPVIVDSLTLSDADGKRTMVSLVGANG